MGGNDLLLDDSLFLKDDNGADGLIFGGTPQNPLAKRQTQVSLNITNGGIMTEEEYKVIKLESNLSNLNKDILNVNEEIE
jgi:hypothetical protein